MPIDVKHTGQQSRANPHAVTGLAKVHRSGVGVDGGRNFTEPLVAREGVHDRRVFLHLRHQLRRQAVTREVNLLHRGHIVGIVMFTLDARHVQGIQVRDRRAAIDHLLQRTDFNNFHSAIAQTLTQLRAQGQLGMFGSDEHHGDVFIQRKERSQRADGPASADVAAEAIDFIGKALRQSCVFFAATDFIVSIGNDRVLRAGELKRALQCINIQECLRRMFIRTRSGVDDGDAPLVQVRQVIHLIGTTFGQAGENASHDNNVEVTAERPNGIEPRLALGFRRDGRVANFVAGDAQDLAGSHEREERSGAGLREVEHGPFVPQQVQQKDGPFSRFGNNADHIGDAGELIEQISIKLIGENDMLQPVLALEVWQFQPDRTLHSGFIFAQIKTIIGRSGRGLLDRFFLLRFVFLARFGHFLLACLGSLVQLYLQTEAAICVRGVIANASSYRIMGFGASSNRQSDCAPMAQLATSDDTLPQPVVIMAIYIDGYNLLHAAGIFPAKHLPGTLHHARGALLEALVQMLPERELAVTMIVFDAAEAPPGLPDRINFHGLDVRFAANHADADEMIEMLIDDCQSPRELVVVSSDHRIHRAARRRKATAIDSDVWFQQLSAKQQIIEEERITAKPQDPLTEGEVDYWMKAFEMDAPGTGQGGTRSKPPPKGRMSKGEPKKQQKKPTTDQELPSDWLESGPYNPFPPGYADDLFEDD